MLYPPPGGRPSAKEASLGSLPILVPEQLTLIDKRKPWEIGSKAEVL